METDAYVAHFLFATPEVPENKGHPTMRSGSVDTVNEDFERPAHLNSQCNQRGIALVLVNSNYRDTQRAFFAMRSGLEEARDRMRRQSNAPLTLPVAMPGSPNSILYIINPSNGETVDPTNSSNAYFDNEFCHESFSGLTSVAPGAPCSSGQGPPPGSVAPYVTSFDPNTGTAGSLKYKWTRIMLKQNGTIYNAAVDPSQAASTQVCYQTLSNQEIPLSLVPGGPYGNCRAGGGRGCESSLYSHLAGGDTPRESTDWPVRGGWSQP